MKTISILKHSNRMVLLLAGWLGVVGLTLAAPEQWRADIEKFAQADAAHPQPTGGVVFVGSSSVRLWTTLAEDFPGVVTINRGFGGSELADSVFYADRIVLPYRPRVVVLYAGDNDIKNGKTPKQVCEDFQAFRTKVHSVLPATKILYLSIKECPAREKWRSQVQEANRLIAADCAASAGCMFVDVTTPLLKPDGGFRNELYRDDQLHLTPAGYAIWQRVLAPHLNPPTGESGAPQ